MSATTRYADMSVILTELLERCQKGEHEAIVMLIARFRAWALDFAASLLHDSSLAEDVVQEAFVIALQHLSALRNPAAFPGWFRQILRSRINRMNRMRCEEPFPQGFDPSGKQESPGEYAQQIELRHQVREVLKNLPPAEYETVELFYLREHSCAEVSDILHIPKGTVKRRLHDARRRLRGMLLGYIGNESIDEE
jgi:RNA polymerase sigma factor (sigma-70 family)